MAEISRDELRAGEFRQSTCLFCGGDEMTREHLLAEWVYRAYQRSRKPRVTPIQQRGNRPWEFGEHGRADQCASVICRVCNNEWVSRIDMRASEILKPLVRRGCEPFVLTPVQQQDAAIWCVKTVMVNDLAITAGKSKLTQYARSFYETGLPAAFLEVWIGPPQLPAPSDTHRVVGVMPKNGTLTLGTGDQAKRHLLHAWSLMLGHGDLFLRPALRWIPLPPVDGYRRIWPVASEPITVTPTSEAQPIQRGPQQIEPWGRR